MQSCSHESFLVRKAMTGERLFWTARISESFDGAYDDRGSSLRRPITIEGRSQAGLPQATLDMARRQKTALEIRTALMDGCFL